MSLLEAAELAGLNTVSLVTSHAVEGPQLAIVLPVYNLSLIHI